MTHDESSMEKSLTKTFEQRKCTFVPKIELLESISCFPLQQKQQYLFHSSCS